MYNQTAREMSSNDWQQLPILACLSKLHHLLHGRVRALAVWLKICLLIYGLSIIVYFWMCLQIRFLFVMEEPKTHFAAWQLKIFRNQEGTGHEHTRHSAAVRGNIICSLLAAPLLHTASRLDQTEVHSYQSLIRRFRRKRSLCPPLSYSTRMMRSFVELCLIGQRWAHMTRWRRQNGLILFRGCRLIDLQIYVYNLSPGATLLFCLDNLPLDPSVLKVQFANYLILDLRFMIFLNATLLGLTFRRLSRSVLYWILALSLLLYSYQILPTPPGLRRNCSKKIRLRPVINVGQRIVDHEVLHLADSDAFYPTIVADVVPGRSGQLPVWTVSWRCLCCSCCEKSVSLASAEQKMQQQQQQQQQQLTPLLQQEELATMSIAEQLVREKYTREETELVLSSLAEGD
uniref:Seipin n=1 Tax=Macrostomum lignano TaxID=282301 RepID=A0A1I8FKQ3_9PLAT